MRLSESTKALSDERVYQYIVECIELLSENGLDVTLDDMDLKESSSPSTLGSMEPPRHGYDNYTLTLSKYLFDSDEEQIKNTIYHELCHYLQFKALVKKGIATIDFMRGLVWSPQYAHISKAEHDKYIGHGELWKYIADVVSKITGQSYSRLANAEETAAFDNAVKSNAKYVVRCKNCGNELPFMRKTAFVKNPNISQYDHMVIDSKIPEDWIKERASEEEIKEYKSTPTYRCGVCNKGGVWEVIENR